jgi:hypothetical protein
MFVYSIEEMAARCSFIGLYPSFAVFVGYVAAVFRMRLKNGEMI